MADFFLEGGFGMFPVLIFGLITIASAGRYAWDLEPARLRFAIVMGIVLCISMSHAMLMNVAAVFYYVQDPARAPDEQMFRIVFEGLKESTRPGGLGGALLSLASVLAAIGVYRDGRRELRASAR